MSSLNALCTRTLNNNDDQTSEISKFYINSLKTYNNTMNLFGFFKKRTFSSL